MLRRQEPDLVIKPIPVERALLDGKLLSSHGTPPHLRLVKVAQEPNQITDDEAWLAKNGLTLPFWKLPSNSDPGDFPENTPLHLPGPRAQAAFRQEDRAFITFGEGYDSTRYLMAVNQKTGEARYLLDFAKVLAPRVNGPDAMQKIPFAQEDTKTGILYVCHAANGYAKESKGKTGYLTAISPKDGKILWRSVPLVANAHTFLLLENVILCGYGFTAEPDYLFVVDQATGRVLQRIALKTGPEYILLKGDRIYVRCYDTNYIFAIRKG